MHDGLLGGGNGGSRTVGKGGRHSEPPGLGGEAVFLVVIWSRMTAGFSLLRAKMQTETTVRYGLECA